MNSGKPRRASAATHARCAALLLGCKRLLSERGETNSMAIARDAGRALRRAARRRSSARFFDHLSRDLSPDPKQVLRCAQAYAEQPERTRPDAR